MDIINTFVDNTIELNVLSYLLNNIDTFYKLPEFYSDKIFYNPENKIINKIIFNSIKKLPKNYDKNHLESNLLIEECFKNNINISQIMEIQYKYCQGSIELNLKILKELQIKRDLVEILNIELTKIDLLTDVYDNLHNLTKNINDLQNFDICENITLPEILKEHQINLQEKVKQVLSGEKYGITTGIKSLDNVIIGWLPTDLIIIAGRPSMGKTAACLQFSLNSRVNTLILSLEMNKQSLIDRFIMNQAESFNGYQLKSGYLNKNNLNEISEIYNNLEQNNKIFIDDFSNENTSKNINKIDLKIRKYIKKYDIKLIIIDYLSLIEHNSKDNNIGYGSITKTLKGIAKQFNLPIILLVQLNRNLESRADKRPILSDLRDSGEIEQDADLVLSLYREDYYSKPEPEYRTNKIEIGIIKHRQGELATIEVEHNESISKIYEPQIFKI